MSLVEIHLPQPYFVISDQYVAGVLGFLAFLIAFPIDRRIPRWFPLNFAEIFTLWFLVVTPVTTVIAIVTIIKTQTNRTDGTTSEIAYVDSDSGQPGGERISFTWYAGGHVLKLHYPASTCRYQPSCFARRFLFRR